MNLILKKKSIIAAIFISKTNMFDIIGKEFFEKSRKDLNKVLKIQKDDIKLWKVLFLQQKINVSSIKDLVKIVNNNHQVFDFIIINKIDFDNFEDFQNFQNKNQKNCLFEKIKILNFFFKEKKIRENEFSLFFKTSDIEIKNISLNDVNTYIEMKFEEEKINETMIMEEIKKLKINKNDKVKLILNMNNTISIKDLNRMKNFIFQNIYNADKFLQTLLNHNLKKKNSKTISKKKKITKNVK
jgi:hypothetical protein